MNPRFFVVALWVLLLSSCARATRATTSPEIFDRELAGAFHDYDRVISHPRTPLAFESGRTVSNCAGYLAERARGETGAAVSNRIVKSEYCICDALDLLRRAQPAQAVRRPPSFYTREIVERLDLRSFLSSLRPKMEDEEHPVMRTLETLSPRTDRFTAISDTEDWYYSFEVVARADFTNDGSEDWLVLFTDQAKEGSYRDYGVLVVEDAARPGLLQVGLQR